MPGELRDSLQSAARWGNYPDPTTSAEIRRLADEDKGRAAFDLIEAAAGPHPKENMFWLRMSEAAELLHLDERAAHYQRRYDDAGDESEAYFAALFERLQAVVRSSATVPEGMAQIIEFCSQARPHADWRLFGELDFAGDVERLTEWFEALVSEEPPSKYLDGLWFGLFNPIYGDIASADIYVAGGEENPDDPGEGFRFDLTWQPKGRYARSPLLHTIYQLAYEGVEDDGWAPGLANDAEYPLCLAYACLSVRWLATTLPSHAILGAAEQLLLEAGFDSGDVLRIGTLTPAGLTFPAGGMVA